MYSTSYFDARLEVNYVWSLNPNTWIVEMIVNEKLLFVNKGRQLLVY